MKKLYALLVILIILFVGINVVANTFHILGAGVDGGNNANPSGTNTVSGSVSLADIDGFKEKKINDTAVRLTDSSDNLTIDVYQIDNSKNISDIANGLIGSGHYTSNQVIDQNGVTTYFLYKESSESYDSEVYFNKNSQNFEIKGDKIGYDTSDKFINACKDIIDST